MSRQRKDKKKLDKKPSERPGRKPEPEKPRPQVAPAPTPDEPSTLILKNDSVIQVQEFNQQKHSTLCTTYVRCQACERTLPVIAIRGETSPQRVRLPDHRCQQGKRCRNADVNFLLPAWRDLPERGFFERDRNTANNEKRMLVRRFDGSPSLPDSAGADDEGMPTCGLRDYLHACPIITLLRFSYEYGLACHHSSQMEDTWLAWADRDNGEIDDLSEISSIIDDVLQERFGFVFGESAITITSNGVTISDGELGGYIRFPFSTAIYTPARDYFFTVPENAWELDEED